MSSLATSRLVQTTGSGTTSSGLAMPNPGGKCSTEYFFVKGKGKEHMEKTSIQHWQLRDLLTCPKEEPEELYYVLDSSIYKHNFLKNSTRQVQQLSFGPTSMTVNCNYLVAGGQESQLLVKDLRNQSVLFNSSVGGSINNACHISQHLNDTRLLISNNDNKIKVYSLPSMSHITDINCTVSINYCSVSPDGTTMVAVGDDTNVLLYDVRNNYSLIGRLQEYRDGGFSCCWDPSSNMFAAASQDGSVVVWDFRTRKVLAKLEAVQRHQLKGACRSVKFAPTACTDLMIFTEHVSYLHIVDTRNFNDHEVIRVGPESTADRHISGACFSSDSKRIFVGLENQIVEYEVDIIRRRSFAGGDIL